MLRGEREGARCSPTATRGANSIWQSVAEEFPTKISPVANEMFLFQTFSNVAYTKCGVSTVSVFACVCGAGVCVTNKATAGMNFKKYLRGTRCAY